jgi:hypothetical protein
LIDALQMKENEANPNGALEEGNKKNPTSLPGFLKVCELDYFI